MDPKPQLFTGFPPRFDFKGFRNARFMYSSGTGEMIVGSGDIANSSHGKEHGVSGARAPFENFVRGWFGRGRNYPNGIIHFAPHFPEHLDAAAFDDLSTALAVFIANGANAGTLLRGAGTAEWEVTLGKAFPSMLLPENLRFRARIPRRNLLRHLGTMAA